MKNYISVVSAHVPEKRKVPRHQWMAYIESQLQRMRSLDPHDRPKR